LEEGPLGRLQRGMNQLAHLFRRQWEPPPEAELTPAVETLQQAVADTVALATKALRYITGRVSERRGTRKEAQA